MPFAILFVHLHKAWSMGGKAKCHATEPQRNTGPTLTNIQTDMDYYIIKDNRRQGPYSIEYLRETGLTQDTKVWREGLDGWTVAADVAELAEFALPAAPPPVDAPQDSKAAATRPPMPKTWLAESIVVTLLCCIVFGVIAIVYSSQVESNYLQGNYEMAEYKSRQARNMVFWGIGIGAGVAVLYIGFIVMGALLSAL